MVYRAQERFTHHALGGSSAGGLWRYCQLVIWFWIFLVLYLDQGVFACPRPNKKKKGHDSLEKQTKNKCDCAVNKCEAEVTCKRRFFFLQVCGTETTAWGENSSKRLEWCVRTGAKKDVGWTDDGAGGKAETWMHSFGLPGPGPRGRTSANDPCARMKNPQRWIELFSLNRTLYACTDTSALYVAAVGEETPLLRDGWSPVTSTHHGYNLYGSRSGP